MTDHEGLEEERRLMYVAITRARKRLYLSHSQTRLLHGQTRYNVKSRFFDELPEAALKWLTPKNQSFGGSAFGYGAGYAQHAQRRRRQRRLEPGPLRQPAGAAAEGRAVARPARRACRCSTPSSAKARCCRSKGRATTRARR